MDRARGPALRRRPPRPLARGRNSPLEARLAHPAFAAVRPWLERLEDPLSPSLHELNALADAADLRVASGAPLRFVAPSAERGGYGDYELRVFASGQVETRVGSRHDAFNALAWLAFPATKAALNARHAAEIPREGGVRGSLRDLLTLLDEGGALVRCADAELRDLLRARQWKALFWSHRDRLSHAMEVQLLGHAVLEQALDPRPGITCKALLVEGDDLDASAAAWVAALPGDARPRELPPLPVFGLPGWHPGGEDPAFYDDERYFRPPGQREPAR